MDALSEHWPELAVVSGIVLALLLASRLILRGARERDPVLQGIPKEMRRAVLERRKAGDELGVADILYRTAHFEVAAEVYARANSPKRAAESYERAGNAAMAIQAYKRAGLHERAARVAYDNGMFVIAANEYASLGQFVRAAECYLKAEEHQQAAEAYARGERYREAGILFARIGQKEQATEQYVKHFEAQLVRAQGKLEGIPEEALKMAFRAATYLKEMDRLPEASALLRRSGHFEEAAPFYLKLGQLEEAADCLVEAGRPDQAAPIYERLGNVKAAARARAEARLLEGDTLGAAHAFARAGDLIRAAQLFREAEDNTAAAEMYRRAGDLVMAAELYSQNDQLELAATLFHEAGEFEQAARIFGSIGKFLQAAESWEEAGNNYEAGAALFKAGRREAALKRLEPVADGDEVGRRARALEGRILFQLGKPELAQQQFLKAIDGRDASGDTVDLFYKLGRCAEAASNMTDALSYYEAVVSVDASFGDAQTRLAAIRDRLVALPQAQPQAPPLVWPTGSPRASGQSTTEQGQGNSKWPVMSRYELLSEIARGGMGVVYKARDRVLNRIVAFKVLSDALKTNKTAVDYFLREARAAAAMSHPNIVTIYDAGEESSDFYMAMEYVEGETLKSLIKRQGAFPEKLLRYIAVHACRGLVFAHNKGLVHRDIKSGNLMLTKEKILKIMDFGLAKFVEDAQLEHTKKIGTPYYMSPEQILGKELDRRSDIYSLGITLFECATGKVPFAKGDLSYHHLHTPPPYAKDFNKNLSDKMNHLIARCIQKRPEERFQRCEDILEVLK